MKNIPFILCLAVTLLLSCLSSCKTTSYPFHDYPDKKIIIGQSGGFTGAMSKYFLLEDGRLFKAEGKDAVTELISLDKRLTKQLFDSYENLKFNKLTLHDPGNMSYFIGMRTKDEDKRLIKWGGGQVEPSPVLLKYYNNLSQLIKKNNYTVK